MLDRLTTEDVFQLARDLGVSMAAACDRAGVNRSTPTRWKHGTKPQPHVLSRLRVAVVAIAREQGGLPETPIFDPVRLARFLEDMRLAREALSRMEAEMAEWLGTLGRNP